MQKAPKIAIERLRVNPPAANHPDADVLTAFSERSLPEVERGIVLEHLALCADCREVLALALPEFSLFQAIHAAEVFPLSSSPRDPAEHGRPQQLVPQDRSDAVNHGEA